MDLVKGILAIYIYNFIRTKQNDIGGAVLIYIAVQPRSHECTRASNTFNIGKYLADLNISFAITNVFGFLDLDSLI